MSEQEMGTSGDNTADEISRGINNGGHVNASTFNNGWTSWKYELHNSYDPTLGQGIHYNHPLFLSPTDISGVNLISFQLIGTENYALWSRSVRLSLLDRNKIGLIDGSCKKEDVSADLRG